MNINMKYYIVTICAIFIALGVGILVGFNLNYDQALSAQQSEVLESFNKEFEDLKGKNKDLQSEIKDLNGDITTLKEFVGKNIDALTKDVLTDKTTGIILTREKDDYSEDIEQLIKNANGKVAFNIVVKDNISKQEKLEELSNELNETFKTSDDVINYIVESLNTAKGYEKLNALQDLGVIKINDLDEQTFSTYDSVVLLGEISGNDIKNKFNEKEKVIIDKLKEESKYLVAANKTNSDNTILELYSGNDISTIDNINEGIGKFSLTNLLKNQNSVGHYGTSDVSTELIAYENN